MDDDNFRELPAWHDITRPPPEPTVPLSTIVSNWAWAVFTIYGGLCVCAFLTSLTWFSILQMWK